LTKRGRTRYQLRPKSGISRKGKEFDKGPDPSLRNKDVRRSEMLGKKGGGTTEKGGGKGKRRKSLSRKNRQEVAVPGGLIFRQGWKMFQK